ncbi:MAG TPA: mechanosensitive ion channel family protein [Polyangiaceae bacterium]
MLASVLSILDPPTAEAELGLAALVNHLTERWAGITTGAAILLVAALVNRFAPAKRARIRRALILFVLYLGFFVASVGLKAAGITVWGGHCRFLADLFEAFTVVNLVALALFDLALPAMRVEVVEILSDLFTGAGYLVSTVLLLRGAGLEPSSVLTTSAVVSGVLALSLQATIGNILGGIALQLDHSIHAGDWVQLPDGTQGKVRAIHWRHTVVETRNWDTILVPNSSLLSSNIIILGKRTGQPVQHRMWVYFNVDFRFSPSQVITTVREALHAAPIERVASDPLPSVICYDFAKDGRDSFGYYAVRYWLTDLATDDPTSSAVRERIYAALRRANIPLARPTQTVFFAPDDSTDVEGRARRHREERGKLLSQIELFKALTDAERAVLTDHLIYAPFARGEVITRQGAIAHYLYVLLSGKAEIRSRVAPDEPPHLVATLAAPALFGEMGLMTGEPRSADVVAITDVTCYRLEKAGFEQILQARPELAKAMAETMAKRRIELLAARDGVSPESRVSEAPDEAARILRGIRSFFGLDGADS